MNFELREQTAASGTPDSVEQLTAALAAVRLDLATCKESLERSQGALCALNDGLVVVDLEGRVTCLNPTGAHLSGWTESEAMGRRLLEVVRFADAKGKPVDVLSAGFEGLSQRPDNLVSLRRRDGHVILVDGTVAEVHDPDKNAIGRVLTFRNVTAAARLVRELAHDANHDPLTGLHNRRAFESKLERAITTAAELGCCHAMLYCDLDRFKEVNDLGGHVAGDELLRQLATLLRRQLRDHDSLARLGGDEFGILLENCTTAQAANVAEKIRHAVEGFEFTWDEQVFRVGTSIGQLDFANDEMLSAEEIVRLADRMCYAAKENGRNQVALHQADISG